jgi:hypothetical protein
VVILSEKWGISNYFQDGDMDDHSVGHFIEITPSSEGFDEALRKPSASDDSDSDDTEFWADIYYLKVFDTSGNELPMTSEIVEGQSIKVIAYKKAIILFSVCFCFDLF